MSKKDHKAEPPESVEPVGSTAATVATEQESAAPPRELTVAELEPAEVAPRDPFVSAAAVEMPEKAKLFSVTDLRGDNSCDVTAIDEPDAIATWCEATGTPAESRKVTVNPAS